MGHSKQNKQQKKDGNHRVETKEERLERLKQQEEARQACFKIMPFAGGVIVLFFAVFSLYVRSVPPRAPKPKQSMDPNMDVNRILQQGLKEVKVTPEFGAGNGGEGEEVPPAEAPSDEVDTDIEPNEERVEL